MKNREKKERKKSWGKVFRPKKRRKYSVGTEPSALVYIGILVTSTTDGPGGSSIRLHKQKQR